MKEKLDEIQGKDGIYFVGAWLGNGFHEDGINSAIDVIKKLGITEMPWRPRHVSPKITIIDNLYYKIFVKYAKLCITKGNLKLILPNGNEIEFGHGKSKSSNLIKNKDQGALEVTVRIYEMSFFKRIVMRHDSGFCESYIDDLFGTKDISKLMYLLVNNLSGMHSNRYIFGIFSWVGDWLLYLNHISKSNTIEGSKKNIYDHYDLGNDMYK